MREIDDDTLTKMGYVHLSDILFMVTKETVTDVVMDRNGWVDYEWTEEAINENMVKFEQALDWHMPDAMHDVIAGVAVDIEIEEGMENE